MNFLIKSQRHLTTNQWLNSIGNLFKDSLKNSIGCNNSLFITRSYFQGKYKKGGKSSPQTPSNKGMKQSYIKFTHEEIVKKRKQLNQNITFEDRVLQMNSVNSNLDINDGDMEMDTNEIIDQPVQTPKSSTIKPKIKIPLTQEEIDSLNSTRLFTDENSSANEIEFEIRFKKLMIEQGTMEISKVRIPNELVELATSEGPEPMNLEDKRFSDLFFSKPVVLEKMAIKSSDFPSKPYPQVAFLGKSNVGKSSLLNSLVNKSELAFTSKTPGTTKTVNFYQMWEKLYLVDLPGYGYAKVSKNKSTVWGESISEYLLTSKIFKVFLLVDSRIGLKKNDIEVMKMLEEHKVPFQMVLTKADKSTPSTLKKIYNDIKIQLRDLVCCLPYIIQSSSVDKTGIDEIRHTILKITGFNKSKFIEKKQNQDKPPQINYKKQLKENENKESKS
ncbi:hypothetical protein DLAC_07945 [Tieghemostelium lacteum]|uniref:EngB-type G domain-containing protein n=1 Tax=Tieghemostelium lacteum TaxID=361077 RepID=A0A151ZAY1_TIELA|nr:hypothetical protein DLAC_07945 [Tieghemostelium lacteum]|eukprot:KYQ91044.1 hypothetical protein DLAC_07945 [Tieghemostelium lacteum]